MANTVSISDLWQRLDQVVDPEIPVLTVLDMGVVRQLHLEQPGETVVSSIDHKEHATDRFNPAHVSLTVDITPTYSGCPAMNMIAAHIKLAFVDFGFRQLTVREVLTPAWTTDWMPETAREKLRAYGIAPPEIKDRMNKLLFSESKPACPRCGAQNTRLLAQFGSTACKSLHQCLECLEPFDYFKCH